MTDFDRILFSLSLGADGSVRLFDLRHLEHSTILYEDMGSSPAGGPANAMAGELPTVHVQ